MGLKENIVEKLNLTFVESTKYNDIYENRNHVFIFHKLTGQLKVKAKDNRLTNKRDETASRQIIVYPKRHSAGIHHDTSHISRKDHAGQLRHSGHGNADGSDR